MGEHKQVRLPDASTVELEAEPDVDLEADDVRDSHDNRVDDTIAERVVQRVYRQLGQPPLGPSGNLRR